MKTDPDQHGNTCGNTSEHLPRPSGTVGGCVGTNTPTGPGAESLLEALGWHRPNWQRDALCREYPNVTFFPDRGQPTAPALQVCGRCLCRADCLAWAMADPDLDHGVLGGMTARARTNARRLDQQRKAKP